MTADMYTIVLLQTDNDEGITIASGETTVDGEWLFDTLEKAVAALKIAEELLAPLPSGTKLGILSNPPPGRYELSGKEIR